MLTPSDRDLLRALTDNMDKAMGHCEMIAQEFDRHGHDCLDELAEKVRDFSNAQMDRALEIFAGIRELLPNKIDNHDKLVVSRRAYLDLLQENSQFYDEVIKEGQHRMALLMVEELKRQNELRRQQPD